MRPYFYLVYGIANTAYILLCYYIGTRILKILSHWLPSINNLIYWIVFGAIAISYIISRFFKAYIPLALTKIITNVGAYWLGALFYLIILLIIIDLTVYILKVTNIVENSVAHNHIYLNTSGALIFIMLTIILVYGTYNARNPRVVEYDIYINKTNNMEKLNAVMVSDIHLGKIIDNGQLIKLVDMIHKIDPDIIFFAGDIVDEDIRPYIKEEMYKTFSKLKPKYGMYACLGNHEYVGGHVEQITQYLEKSGITVLVDEHVLVENSFYVGGRNDPAGFTMTGVPRKDLDQWLGDTDKSLPIILMDHQPKSIKEAELNGVDLLLSGHTHKGQMFPSSLITNIMFENHWGLSETGDMNVIVSSGYGTWGPPIRIGTKGEVVKINITFKEEE